MPTATLKLGKLPEKSRITLLMGDESDDGRADARSVVAWVYGSNGKDKQELPYITVPANKWNSPTNHETELVSPTSDKDEVPFRGTDGMQFRPNISPKSSQ